jgi:BlaI family penicillinase repressor
MNVVWKFKRFPVTVRQVLEQAYPKGEKAYTTVQTIMNNLTEKGLLIREKIGPVNVYNPKVSADVAQKKETFRFVNKVFNGSFFSLANFLLSSGRLTREEIEQLKQMLEQNNRGKQND